MHLKKYEIVSIITFVLLACILVGVISVGITANAASQALVQPAPTATIAIAPIENENDIDVVDVAPDQIDTLATVDPLLLPTSDPRIPTADIPAIVGDRPADQINIMLLGSDYRPGMGYRTDVIMMLSINPSLNSASLISFPRDLWVSIPGVGYQRINTAHQFGGFALLADTFEENFGVHPDYYMMVDFNGFKYIIDSLGGIVVDTPVNLSDTCATWINPSGWCSVGPGQVSMNGDLALWYSRSRYSTNDFDRTRRAQEVVQAIFSKIISIDGLMKVNELYSLYSQYVQTDINLPLILKLLPMASSLQNMNNIQRYSIGTGQVTNWTTPEGAMVLLPNYDAIHAIIKEALHWQ